MAAKDAELKKSEEGQESSGPMLDMSQAAVKKMIATAKARGYITYDELNEVMPPEQVTSEQIEDVMAMLSEMGINVIDGDDGEEEDRPAAPEIGEAESGSRDLAITSVGGEALDRTDDPVRMYLREMGSVELLSREGEIAIAKRIEAGRNTMIAGLCESPMTFQAITIWRDELLSEEIMLRDVIDLETTFGASMETDDVDSVLGAVKIERIDAENLDGDTASKLDAIGRMLAPVLSRRPAARLPARHPPGGATDVAAPQRSPTLVAAWRRLRWLPPGVDGPPDATGGEGPGSTTGSGGRL